VETNSRAFAHTSVNRADEFMTPAREVLIRGDGVAALCCARLLKNAGFRVAMERTARPRVPAIMLSDAAVALISDVFGVQPAFAACNRISRRVVAWGRDTSPVELPHSAIVVSETVLLESLANGFEPDVTASPEFVIHASKPLPPATEEHRFGTRSVVAAEVVLKKCGDVSGCRIESLNEGWLFLIPNGPDSAWVLGTGAKIESLLATSRVIAPRIELRRVRSGEFPSAPRIVAPLCGENWLACGTAAIGFDPICGDGTAQAVREAVLSSAVLRAIAEGGDAASLFAHYETRMTAGMLRHLMLSSEFYRGGGVGPWWQNELAAMQEGHRWCQAKLAAAGEPRYQLRGFVLERRR